VNALVQLQHKGAGPERAVLEIFGFQVVTT